MAWSKTKIAIISGAALLLATGTTLLTVSVIRHVYRQAQAAEVVPPLAMAPPTNSLVIPEEVVISPIRTSTPDAEGFISLFNGVDLQGWSYNPHVWSVEDGAMTGRITPEAEYHVFCIAWSGGQVSDFELRIRFRTGGLENSGVAVRSRWAQQRYFPGYQVEIHGPRTGLFIIAGPGRERQLGREGFRTIASEKDGANALDVFEPLAELEKINDARATIEEGQWCELVIIAKDRHFATRLNGVPVVDTMDDHPEKFVGRGQIGFEYTHRKGIEDFVQFKDIRFKRLDAVTGPQARREE